MDGAGDVVKVSEPPVSGVYTVEADGDPDGAGEVSAGG